MKKQLFLTLIIAALLAAGGCKKWLDVSSKTDVVENDMFTDEQGFMDAMAGVYYIMADNDLYGDKLTMSLLDAVANRYNFEWYTNAEYGTDLNTAGYYARDNIRTMINNIWQKEYNAIANINNLLNHIDGGRGLFNQDNYQLMKGEALGLRAFLHFDLLRMFGPSWVTGADKPAIPYVTAFSGKLVTPISSVKAVTDSILSDLHRSLALLEKDDLRSSSQDNPWVNNRKCHFNKLAAQALLARVYLYRGEAANALLYASNVINSGKLDFVKPAALQNRPFDFSFTPEQVFSLSKYDITLLFNKYFTQSYSSQLTNDCGKAYGNTQSVERIYEVSGGNSSDVRYNNMWLAYNSYYSFNRYNQVNALEINLVPLIRLPEMYYIAAECSPLEDGIEYLNTVRNRRGLLPLPVPADKAALQNEVFKEYQKEFYTEGQLFYYYKRLNMPEMMKYNNIDRVSSAAPGYVFPIPAEEITLGNR
ncbi:MAG: RagB/SusD family nutrient uptake outer membrane protein [Candidatus Pseudobacter hemicellulosilyticus]|uniref:RagB/SusD family nutrient uptake outer membrane protein n=1 Tax=Candidatus Pseudobacter hemicellulosilyticus TaxID=3121375 RepID=A0AAJ5WPK9_9BACT|nr:MAG: RagB/SusD family nutrient uptake outer membrane protein [Pseudobacter sp.]